MKQYIGTKLIEAEKAYRVNGEAAVRLDEPVEHGYKVRYADGYGVARIELPEEG